MIVVDVPKDPSSSQRLDLDQNGVEYTIDFLWSKKFQRFYMDLYDPSGSVIAQGIKLVRGTTINLGIRQANGPSGLFVVVGNGSMSRRSFTNQGLRLLYVPRKSLSLFPLSNDYILASDFINFLEEQIPEEDVMLFEDSETMLFEDGESMLFE